MPMSHTIDDGLVVIRVSGKVDNEDHRVCFDAILADPEFTPGIGVLLFDTGGLYAPSSDEAQAFVKQIGEYQKPAALNRIGGGDIGKIPEPSPASKRIRDRPIAIRG